MTLEQLKALLEDANKSLKERLEVAEAALAALAEGDAKVDFAAEVEKAKDAFKAELAAAKETETVTKLEALESKIDAMKFDASPEDEDKKEEKFARAWTKALLSSSSPMELKANVDALREKFALTDGQNITNNVDGGFLVPQVMANFILKDTVNEFAPILGLTRRTPMGENLSVNVNIGVPNAKRAGEGDAAIKSKSQYRQVDLKAERCSVTVPATMEYLMWSMGDAKARIQADVAEGYAAKFLWELFNGVAASKQLAGILLDTDVIAAATTSSVIGGFTYEDLVDLEGSITTNNETNLRYVMDRTTLAEVRKLQDGAGNYIFTPGEKGKPSTINGIPVMLTGKVTVNNGTDVASRQVMPIVANDAYPIMLADFSGYLFGDAKGMTMMFDDKTGASEATLFWNFHVWNDGVVALPEKFKLLKIKAS